MKEDHPVVNWEDMTEADQAKAMDLLGQLNKLFDEYADKEDPDAGKEISSTQD
jgi:hypothetical protein